MYTIGNFGCRVCSSDAWWLVGKNGNDHQCPSRGNNIAHSYKVKNNTGHVHSLVTRSFT